MVISSGHKGKTGPTAGVMVLLERETWMLQLHSVLLSASAEMAPGSRSTFLGTIWTPGSHQLLKPRFERCASFQAWMKLLPRLNSALIGLRGCHRFVSEQAAGEERGSFVEVYRSSSGSVRKLSHAGMNNFFQCSPKSWDVGIVNPVFIDEKLRPREALKICSASTWEC